MRLFTKAVLPVLILSTALTGCGAAADYSTLTFDRKGGVTQVIVEDWDQEQYDKNELQTQIETDIASYGSAVSLHSVKTTDTSVIVNMSYETVDAYTAYNKVPLFEGSISDCQAAGYLLEGEFKDASGEDMDRTSVLSLGKDCTVLVFQEPVEVKVPGKIICYSSSLELSGKKKAKASLPEESEDFLLENPVYVIYQ